MTSVFSGSDRRFPGEEAKIPKETVHSSQDLRQKDYSKLFKIYSLLSSMEKIEGQQCPVCMEKKLTLSEETKDIPYFGKTYLFSMVCSGCEFHKSDLEAAERKEPCKITFQVEGEKDLSVRVVKSSEASVSIPQLKASMTPGPASEGFVSNVEGMLDKFKKIIEDQRDLSEDDGEKTTAKNLLKKIWKVKCGDIPITLIIEDPSGNSAIISEKTKIEKLKTKKA